MFTRAPDASKVSLAALVALLQQRGVILIDCQQTEHLASMGERPVFAAQVRTPPRRIDTLECGACRLERGADSGARVSNLKDLPLATLQFYATAPYP